jgi:hypothetical protein
MTRGADDVGIVVADLLSGTHRSLLLEKRETSQQDRGETPGQETRQQTAHPPAIAAVLDRSPVRTLEKCRG